MSIPLGTPSIRMWTDSRNTLPVPMKMMTLMPTDMTASRRYQCKDIEEDVGGVGKKGERIGPYPARYLGKEGQPGEGYCKFQPLGNVRIH